MAMERSSSSTSSRPLHNFDLHGLRWGSQRYLRCMNVDSSPDSSARRNSNGSPVIGKRKERENFDDSPTDSRRRSDYRKLGFPPLPPETDRSRRTRMPPESGADGEGIAAVREKLMIDLQTETDKIKVAIFKEGLEADAAAAVENPASFPPPPASRPVSSSAAAEPETRPWNLRTRRAACKAPTMPNGTSNGIAGTSPMKAPRHELTKPNSALSPSRLRSGAGIAAMSPANEKERPMFSVSLSRREIDEDFFVIAGRKPPRRPQKRLRHVQRTLDTLFPGLWLSEINADMYKVPENQ